MKLWMLWIPLIALVAILALVFTLHRPVTKPACVLDECPFEIHDADTGGAYTYRTTSRFTIVLDPAKNPQAHLVITCAPEGTVGAISNVPAVDAPLYALRFEGVQPGSCTFTDDNFRVSVKIVDRD